MFNNATLVITVVLHGIIKTLGRLIELTYDFLCWKVRKFLILAMWKRNDVRNNSISKSTESKYEFYDQDLFQSLAINNVTCMC